MSKWTEFGKLRNLQFRNWCRRERKVNKHILITGYKLTTTWSSSEIIKRKLWWNKEKNLIKFCSEAFWLIFGEKWKNKRNRAFETIWPDNHLQFDNMNIQCTQWYISEKFFEIKKTYNIFFLPKLILLFILFLAYHFSLCDFEFPTILHFSIYFRHVRFLCFFFVEWKIYIVCTVHWAEQKVFFSEFFFLLKHILCDGIYIL